MRIDIQELITLVQNNNSVSFDIITKHLKLPGINHFFDWLYITKIEQVTVNWSAYLITFMNKEELLKILEDIQSKEDAMGKLKKHYLPEGEIEALTTIQTNLGIKLSFTTQLNSSNHQVYIRNSRVHGIFIKNSRLESFPEEILRFHNLEILDLSNNKIRTIPSELFDISSIRILNLSWNEIEILPANIGNLINLAKLDLWYNKIKIIPSSIGLCQKLRHLTINANLVEELPETIMNLTKLEILNLQQNKLPRQELEFRRWFRSLRHNGAKVTIN